MVISTAKGKLTKKKKAVAELLAAPSQLSIADVCAKEQLTLADLCRLFDEKDDKNSYRHEHQGSAE